MLLRKLMGLFACTLIIGAASFAIAGVPDPDQCVATVAGGVAETLTLFNLPNGTGAPFTGATGPSGGVVDATISLTVVDANGDPIELFPFEDMWIQSEVAVGETYAPCVGGNLANFSTDEFGMTEWANPLNAGGWTQGLLFVMINGNAITTNSGLPIQFNSADISGDGSADLSDLGIFAQDYYGVYAFRSDFNGDGAVNLSDVGRMALGIGAECP